MRTIPNAELILNKLIDENVINEELINQTALRVLNDSMKHCVDVIHTMLCTEMHTPKHCTFYDERDDWDGHAHQGWIKRTKCLMDRIGISDQDEMIRHLGLLNEVLTLVDKNNVAETLEAYVLYRHGHLSLQNETRPLEQ